MEQNLHWEERSSSYGHLLGLRRNRKEKAVSQVVLADHALHLKLVIDENVIRHTEWLDLL